MTNNGDSDGLQSGDGDWLCWLWWDFIPNNLTGVRVLLQKATLKNLLLHQMDIKKTAYFDVFNLQPEHFWHTDFMLMAKDISQGSSLDLQ